MFSNTNQIAPGRRDRIFARTARASAAIAGVYRARNESSCSSGDRSLTVAEAPSSRRSRAPRRPSDEARPPPRDAATEASPMIAPFEGPGGEPLERRGTEGRLAKPHVHRIVEALHPDGHRGLASPARPSFGHAMKALPEGLPQPSSKGQRGPPRAFGKTECASVLRVRNDVALPQRQSELPHP